MRGGAVLVHGGWAHPEDWRWVADRLRAEDVEVRAVDLPSHHSSSASRADDVALVEKTVAELSAPVVVVGWSYGGSVVTDLEVDPRVARLVYVASIPATPGGATGGGGGGFDLSWLVFPDDRSCVLDEERWLTETGATFPSGVVEHLEGCPRRPIALHAVLAPPERFAWQGVPTTLLLGRGDAFFPRARQEWAQATFDDVRLIDSDHFIPFRQPELIAEIVVEALNPGSADVGATP